MTVTAAGGETILAFSAPKPSFYNDFEGVVSAEAVLCGQLIEPIRAQDEKTTNIFYLFCTSPGLAGGTQADGTRVCRLLLTFTPAPSLKGSGVKYRRLPPAAGSRRRRRVL